MEQSTITSRNSRRTKHQIQKLLIEFENSELSVTEFCKLHKICNASFHKWKKRYNEQPSGFASVALYEPALVSSGLFAQVNGIYIYQPVSASFLKQLLQ